MAGNAQLWVGWTLRLAHSNSTSSPTWRNWEAPGCEVVLPDRWVPESFEGGKKAIPFYHLSTGSGQWDCWQGPDSVLHHRVGGGKDNSDRMTVSKPPDLSYGGMTLIPKAQWLPLLQHFQ